MSLSAGPYVIDHMSSNGFSATTCFFAENRDLASRYLTASLAGLKYFSQRFGTYPYADFGEVENFFPTGYGFPGYTLMGGGSCGYRSFRRQACHMKLHTTGGETG